MSKEQAKGFFEAISRDKQLAEAVKEVVGGRTSNEVKAKALFDLASGHGFNFSKNEAISLTRDELKTSLKIESLSDVSGGAKGSIKPAVMAAFLLAGMGVSGAAMSNMEASAAPPKVQAEQSVNSYDVYTADDFVNFFTREDYQGQATRGVTITLQSDISLTADQARAVMQATNRRNSEPGNPYDKSFHGMLDGGGHSITLNFTEPAGGWFHGLFTYTDGATFRNLHVQFDRMCGNVTGVLVCDATDSTFDSVVVTGNSIETTLEGQNNGWPLPIGSIGSACCGTCKLTNCVARIGSINIRSERESCPLRVGGLVGYGQTTVASNCAFSGNISVSSTSSTTSDVLAGGIGGCFAEFGGAPVIENCVVSDSQITTNADQECAAGAIAGCCCEKSAVLNSAALNCSVDAGKGYAGQIVGCSVPYIINSPSRISTTLDKAEPDAPEPQIYGCFYTNEGPAVGRERTPNPSAAAQEDQDSIIYLLPDLAPVIGRLQNPQGQQTSLVSSALKWVGSWFGFGGKK